eukprot:Phypoly_transcript_06117.p1 GENE.Phypoly_transcript_06117~~Phypoly_transcript_06117.p1  ORF type:complete len:564 (-),score=86.10 Phypoly_transcript_06117:62-1753(-)
MMKSVSPVNPLKSSYPPYTPSSKTQVKFLLDPTNPVDFSELTKLEWTASESSAQEFLDCIVNLVTYNGCYLPSCFQILVQGFIPKLNRNSDFDLELSDKVSHLIHETLRKIVTLIPLSLPILGSALKERFPHKRNNSEEMFAYLKNLLLVSYYAPSLIESLITTAVDRLIQIDVDIKLEDIPEEPEEQLQFEVELEQNTPQSPGVAELTARKLDSMMIVMFEYFDAAFGNVPSEARDQPMFPPMNLTQTHREQLFNILLQIFDKYILTTYKSKYTQFLLFYVCRLKPDAGNSFSSVFMAYLYNKIHQHKNQRNANQMASAAYLGSYMARASFVPVPTLREVVTFILNWTLAYINTHPNITPDAVVHGLFYSMCQSLYYIFCFHHESLRKEGDTDSLKRGYRRITESKFNPLKFCLLTITREFVRVYAEIGWHDYTELMKNNEKLVLATKSTFGGSNQLEMFFPFDPYLLKYSSKYIDPYYVKWSGKDEDEEEDEEEEAEADDKPAFADSDSDSSDDDAGGNDDESDEDDRQSSDDMEQLTNDFMHFTPDVERDISFHHQFSFD